MNEIIRILIVDDSMEILNILKFGLEAPDRELVTAHSGEEFRQIDLARHFDVALIDIKLPDIQPQEIIDILHKAHAFTQIIIITGNSSEEGVIKFLRQGVFDYILKPLSIVYLENRILKAVERKQLLEENENFMIRLSEQNRQLQLQRNRLEMLLDDTARELFQITEYLKTTVANLPEGLLLLDSDYRIKIANKNAEELLQLPLDYRDKSCMELNCDNEVWPYFINKLKVIGNVKEEGTVEILPNDKIVFFEIVPITIDSEVVNYLAITKDITMEYRQKSWLEAVMNTLIDGITIIDKDRNIIWMNQVASEWYENFNTGVDKHCYSWFHCADEPHPKCPAMKTFNDGKIHRTTMREITKAGEERFFDVITGAIRPQFGSVHQVVEIRRDVTARVRMITDLQEAMEDLERLNSRLNQKIEQLSIIAQITDTLQSTNNLTEILHIILTAVTAEQGLGFNRAFLLLLDGDKQYLKGEYAIGPSDPEEAGRIWAELSRSKNATLHEVLGSYRLVTADTNILAKQRVTYFNIPVTETDNILIDSLMNHRIFNFTLNEAERDVSGVTALLDTDRFAVVPVHTMTENLGVLLVDNKITHSTISDNELEFLRVITNHAGLAIERSYLASELQEKYTELGDMLNRLRDNQRKLIRAEKLSIVGQMAAQLAHEIKNPLVSIGGFARNLLRDRSDMDQTTIRKLEIIRDETSRIERIVTDLLRFARIQEPRFDNGNINEIINKTLEIVQIQLEQKNISTTTDFDASIPDSQMDKEQIHQVLLNLLSNAISATPENGEIHVLSKFSTDHAYIEVHDTGVGIPLEFKERIFEPFFTTKSAGTGLGLAISAQIIKKHKGSIWFTSAPDKGTVFHIKLPVNIQND